MGKDLEEGLGVVFQAWVFASCKGQQRRGRILPDGKILSDLLGGWVKRAPWFTLLAWNGGIHY